MIKIGNSIEMSRNIRWLLSCLFIFLLGTTHFCAAAILQVDPIKIRQNIPAGQSESGKITLRNPSDKAIKVKIYSQDWQYSKAHDGTKEFFPAGTLSSSCANWISLSLAELEIPAEGQQDIYYTVKMANDAVGEYFAVLFFESAVATPVATGNVSMGLIVRIGAIFYVETAGMSLRTAELDKLSLKKQSKSQPLEIGVDLKNTGNTDIAAKGTFHIINKKGVVLARSSFNKIYTFPNEIARLNGTWKERLPKGIYDVIITIDIGKVMQEEEWNADFVITKETEIEIGSSGEVLKVGELR